MKHGCSYTEARNELIYRIIEEKIEGNRYQERPRTSFVKQIVSDARL